MSQEGTEEPAKQDIMEAMMDTVRKSTADQGKTNSIEQEPPQESGMIPIPGEDIQIPGGESKQGSAVSQGNQSHEEDPEPELEPEPEYLEFQRP